MKKISFSAITATAIFAPLLAFAQNFNTGYIYSVFNFIESIIGRLFPIAAALVVLYFFYEVYQFMKAEPAKKEDARKGLLSSLLAVFLVFALFGIIALLRSITGTDQTSTLDSDNVTQIKF